MATLTERLDKQIAALTDEYARIERQSVADLADVAAKLAVLEKSKSAITKEVEQAYVALLGLGLIKEIE